MKKICYSFCGLAMMLLVSCNLFIDDEFAIDAGNWEVPVHTGYGYDEPVTINDDGCVVTYQFNSDVRVVEEEEQDKYILGIDRSEGNGVIKIHYAASTPQELLPVPGEVLLSTATAKFPWGCNHRVEGRTMEDGNYVYLLTAATFDDTYKELCIDGSVTKGKSGVYYDEDYEPVAEEEMTSSSGQQEATQTRADGDVFGSDKITKETKVLAFEFLRGGGMGIYAPLNIYKSEGTGPLSVSASFTMQYNIIWDYSFNNFNLSEGRLWMMETCRKEFTWELTLSGTASFHKDLVPRKAIPGLRGHVVSVGPVVLVFFGEIEVSSDISFSANVTLSGTSITRQKILHDLRDQKEGGKPTKREIEDKVIKDEPLDLSVSIALDFYITVKVHLCMGIYGKIISLRIIPTFKILHFNATVPVISTKMYKGAYFIPGKEGITFTPLEFSVELGVFLDLNLRNLIDAFKMSKGDPEKKALQEYTKEIKTETQYYKDHIGEYKPSELYKKPTTNKEAYKEGDSGVGEEVSLIHDSEDGDNLRGLSIILGPWFPIDPIKWPWFPVIDEGSFKAVPSTYYTDDDAGTMTYEAEYWVKDPGLLSKFFDYIPAIGVSQGGVHKGIVYSNYNQETVKKRYYRFKIPGLKYGKDYTLYPVFVKPGETFPSAYDDGKNVLPLKNELVCTDWGFEKPKQYVLDDGVIKNELTILLEVSVSGEQNYDTWRLGVGYVDRAHNELVRKHISYEDIHKHFKPKKSEGYNKYLIKVPVAWFTYSNKLESDDEKDEAEVWFWFNWRMKDSKEKDEETRPVIGYVMQPGHYVYIYKGDTDEHSRGWAQASNQIWDGWAEADVYF